MSIVLATYLGLTNDQEVEAVLGVCSTTLGCARYPVVYLDCAAGSQLNRAMANQTPFHLHGEALETTSTFSPTSLAAAYQIHVRCAGSG